MLCILTADNWSIIWHPMACSAINTVAIEWILSEEALSYPLAPIGILPLLLKLLLNNLVVL